MELDITFTDSAEWEAMRTAEAFLEARGFSVGRMQGREPRGILFGAFDIQKWRNLSAADIRALDGKMTGDMRHGPVCVRFFNSLSDAGWAAIKAQPVVVRSLPLARTTT